MSRPIIFAQLAADHPQNKGCAPVAGLVAVELPDNWGIFGGPTTVGNVLEAAIAWRMFGGLMPKDLADAVDVLIAEREP